jgi:hypothetical protein
LTQAQVFESRSFKQGLLGACRVIHSDRVKITKSTTALPNSRLKK